MESNYTIRKAKKAGITTYLVQCEDTIKPYSWVKLRAYLDRSGGVYLKNKWSHEFQEDPRDLIKSYIDENCSEFIPQLVDFRRICKAKTNINGPRGEQAKLEARAQNAKRGPARRIRGSIKGIATEKASELLLLRKRNEELTAELQRLKGEGIEMAEAKAVKDQAQEQKRKKAEQAKDEKEKAEKIRATKLKIITAKNISDLTELREEWSEVEEVDNLITSQIIALTEKNELQEVEKAKDQLIHFLAANNGKGLSYEELKMHGIDPTGSDMVVHGIRLIRRYNLFSYAVKVPDDFSF